MSRNIVDINARGGERNEELEDPDHGPHNPHSHLVHGSPSLASYSFAGNFSADDLQELLGAMAGEHAHSNAHAHHRTLHGNEDPDEGDSNNSHCHSHSLGHSNGHNDIHHTNAPSMSDNIDPEAKAQARSDRKRSREKQRRSDINKQFDDLQAVLKVIEAEEKEGYVYASALTASSSSSARATNRVELMARTIHYLEKFRHSQKKLKRDVQMLQEQLMQARKAGEETAAKLKEIVFQQPPSAPTKQVMMMVPMMVSADGTTSYAPQCAAGMPFMNAAQGSFFMPQPFMNNQQPQQQQQAPSPTVQATSNNGTPAPGPSTNIEVQTQSQGQSTQNGTPAADNTTPTSSSPAPAPVPIMPHPSNAMMHPIMHQYPMINMNMNVNAHHSAGQQQQQQPSYFMAAPNTNHASPQVMGMVPSTNQGEQYGHNGQPQFIFPGMGQAGMMPSATMPQPITMGMINPGPHHSGMTGATISQPHTADGRDGNPSPTPAHSTSPTNEEVAAKEGADHPNKTSQTGGNGNSNLAHCA